MKSVLIKSKLKGPLIQAAAANPWRVFRMRILEVPLLITLPNSSFLPSLLPKGARKLHEIRFIMKILLQLLKKAFAPLSQWPEALAPSQSK